MGLKELVQSISDNGKITWVKNLSPLSLGRVLGIVQDSGVATFQTNICKKSLTWWSLKRLDIFFL